MWDDMEKDVGEFVRNHLYCVGYLASNVVPRPMGDMVHGAKVGGVPHFYYLSPGKSDAVGVAGLVEGGYGHLLV